MTKSNNKTSARQQPNKNLLSILLFFCCKKTIGAQNELADQLEVASATITRIKNGQRNWGEDLVRSAYELLKERKPAIQLADLYEDDTVKLLEKFSLDTQNYHRLMSTLKTPDAGWQVRAQEDLRKLIGSYVSLYLCIDPNKPSQLGVALDGFEFKEEGNRSDQLYVEQTNYELDDENDVLPTGNLRLRRDIIEIDIDYRNPKFPNGTYLAFRPEADVRGRHNFIATTLNVKINSKLVVARPTIFLQIAESLTEWRILSNTSRLFEATHTFLESNAQFERSNFELCPNPRPTPSAWIDVIKETSSAIAKLHQPR